MLRIGIIGAGMAGLSCADALAELGHKAFLFDKGRSPGGRMSTRRLETAVGEAVFDHGAQYFTVRDTQFAAQVERWAAQGHAARWASAGLDAWVGTPAMNAVIKEIAARHDLTMGRKVEAISRDNRGWWLLSDEALDGPFDACVIALPAEQAATLLALSDIGMAQIALYSRSQPCWTAMYAFASHVQSQVQVIRNSGPIAWATCNSAKPERTGPESWVVQANAKWSRENIDATHEQIEQALLAVLQSALDVELTDPIAASVQRWRYALSAGSDLGSLWNDDIQLGACGDWLLGPRVECAWLSGQALAQRVAGVTTRAKEEEFTDMVWEPAGQADGLRPVM